MSTRVSAKILTWPRTLETPRRRLGTRRSRAVAICVLVMLAILAAAVSRTSLFGVDSIAVEGVAGDRRAEVLAVAGLQEGSPLISVDESSIEQRLEQVAWVAGAEVSAPLSGQVTVAVSERSPVALVQTNDRRWAQLGSGGRVIAISDQPTKGLPAILETQVAPSVGAFLDPAFGVLLRVGDLLPDSLRPNVLQMVSSPGNVRLGLASGTIVELGDDRDLANKLMAAATVMSHSEAKDIAVLDVRSPHLPIATPRNPPPPTK